MSKDESGLFIRFEKFTEYSFVIKVIIGEEDRKILLVSSPFWLLPDLQRLFGLFILETSLSLERAYLTYESFKMDNPNFPSFYIELDDEAKREYEEFLLDVDKTKKPDDLN